MPRRFPLGIRFVIFLGQLFLCKWGTLRFERRLSHTMMMMIMMITLCGDNLRVLMGRRAAQSDRAVKCDFFAINLCAFMRGGGMGGSAIIIDIVVSFVVRIVARLRQQNNKTAFWWRGVSCVCVCGRPSHTFTYQITLYIHICA